MDTRMTADYQESVRKMVDREVYYCVSTLVYELCQQWESFPDYEDELLSAGLGLPDYAEAIYQAVRDWNRDECVDYLESLCIHCDDDEPIQVLRDAVEANAAEEGREEFCEAFGIDTDDYDIYEHWIVSEWLAGELEERGELVLRDFFGLTVWGRSTTGQSISIDGVICDIYDALHREAA